MSHHIHYYFLSFNIFNHFFPLDFLLHNISSMITSQGMVLATAMAVSGTVIVLALRLQRSFPATLFPVHEISQPSTPILRSCISSVGNKRGKKKKRVHFADDTDSRGDGEEFRRQQRMNRNSLCSKSESKVEKNCDGKSDVRGMPANRVALYNGIFRDRAAQRLTYSY